MKTTHATITMIAGLGLALAAGCSMQEPLDELEDPAVIEEALELENGGLEMTDEAPLFDESFLFDEAELETRVSDALEDDAEVVAMRDAVDAVVYQVAVMWGQLPGDPTNDVVYDWSGELRVNRGALLVRAALAFDGRTDHLRPRTDRQRVRFDSVTRPHRDGLKLVIIDPTPEAAEPMTLTYEQAGGDTFTATLDDLVAGPRTVEFDDAGNRMVAIAHRRPVDVCEHGFLRGRWHQVTENLGRLAGVVVSADGDGVGHMRGIYGVRRNGDQVFFGKFIDRAGAFRGIFRGTYARGEFQGRWLTRDGDHGGLGGEYREGRDVRGDRRLGGHFLGRWGETRCDGPRR